MRLSKIAALLILPSILFATAHTCTLTNAAGAGSACFTKTCAASAIVADASHANWSGTGCTANGYTPANDALIVPDTYNLIDDVGWTLGLSGNSVMGNVSGFTFFAGTGVTGNGTCNFTTTGGSFTDAATGTITVASGKITAVAVTHRGQYTSASATPTVTVPSTGNCSGLIAATVTPTYEPGNGTAAVNINATGTFTVAAHTIFRGAIIYTGGVGNTTDGLIMTAGASFTYDYSATAGGILPIYTYAATAATGVRKFKANCTSVAHCVINVTGGASGIGSLGGSGFVDDGAILLNYADVTNMGDALSYGVYIETDGSGALSTYSVQHSTFTNCGMIRSKANLLAGGTFIHDYNVHTGTLGGTDLFPLASSTKTSGTREIIGNVFATQLGSGGGGAGASEFANFTITDNWLEGGIEIFGTNTAHAVTFARNVLHYSPGATIPTDWGTADITDCYVFVDTNYNNPHMFTYPGVGLNVTRVVFEQTKVGGAGVAIINLTNPGSAKTTSLVNSIHLPTATGQGMVQGTSAQGFTTNQTVTASHNTWVGSDGFASAAVVAINEVSDGFANQITAEKNNLTYRNGSGTFYKMFNNDTTTNPLPLDVLAPSTGDYNFASAGLTLTQTCAACTNQGLGYAGRWSVTPGAHDQSNVVPMFVDTNRTLVLWDSKYKGLTAAALGGAAWAVGHGTYNKGDIVSNTGSIYSSSPGILYICTVGHSSGSTTEPGAGANWQNDWEWYGVYSMRQDIATQATFTDASLQGCSVATPCGGPLARLGWIRTGYIPQAAIAFKAGDDGATIGAVDSPTMAAIVPVVSQ